jgi:hypothetical protein
VGWPSPFPKAGPGAALQGGARDSRLSGFVLGPRRQNLKGRPVLTVGESEHFVQEGGMIGFFLEDNKVRCEIHLTAAEPPI